VAGIDEAIRLDDFLAWTLRPISPPAWYFETAMFG
jgi:hypothetical protein